MVLTLTYTLSNSSLVPSTLYLSRSPLLTLKWIAADFPKELYSNLVEQSSVQKKYANIKVFIMLIAIAVFCAFTICSNLDMTPAAALLSKDINVVDCQLRSNDKKCISSLSMTMLVTAVVSLLPEGTWLAARLIILITLPKLTTARDLFQELSATDCMPMQRMVFVPWMLIFIRTRSAALRLSIASVQFRTTWQSQLVGDEETWYFRSCGYS